MMWCDVAAEIISWELGLHPELELVFVVWQEMKLMFPTAQRMNRGNHEVNALVQACKANSVTDLVVLHETRGQPGRSRSTSHIPQSLYLEHEGVSSG